jgi:amidase
MKRISFKQVGLKYTLNPYDEPIIRIKPKETIVVEVEDAPSGQIRKEGDVRDRDKIPFGNPVMGLIYIEGAEEGGTISVNIKDIKPTIGQGSTYLSEFNQRYLTDVPILRFLNSSLPRRTKICKIKGGAVQFDDLTLPYRPMVGTVGVAPHPQAESISSSVMPGQHGGNMDISDICPGSTVFLPVFNEGGFLYIGDAHALQGDGEISGTAVEMPAELTIKVDIAKGSINWPRIETAHEIMVATSTSAARSFEDAIRTAFLELTMWMEEKCDIDRLDCLMLCSQVGRIRVGNLWTVAAAIEKKYLRK